MLLFILRPVRDPFSEISRFPRAEFIDFPFAYLLELRFDFHPEAQSRSVFALPRCPMTSSHFALYIDGPHWRTFCDFALPSAQPGGWGNRRAARKKLSPGVSVGVCYALLQLVRLGSSHKL